jgi:uncharacterized protein (TIGR02284 family)
MADDAVSVLNNLIETCKDGEAGFRHAAEKASESSLKTLFLKYAGQRAGYAQELQSLVAAAGEKPAESGSITASFHRGWISLKEAVAKNDDKALVDEAEAGEEEAHGVIRDLKHNWRGSLASTGATV